MNPLLKRALLAGAAMLLLTASVSAQRGVDSRPSVSAPSGPARPAVPPSVVPPTTTTPPVTPPTVPPPTTSPGNEWDSPGSRWMFVTSDPQYPWVPSPGGDEHARSRALIHQQYDSVNAWAKGKEVLGAFVNGDLTAFGHQDQVDFMIGALKRLKMPVYLGLGNHDYENNVNDCAENHCARRSVYWFAEHMSRHWLDAFDLRFYNWYDFPSFFEEIQGSLGWTKSFGNFTVIQLNNYPEYETYAEGYSFARAMREVIRVKSSLQWLEGQMREARRHGKAIVLMMHIPQGSQAFHDLIDRYEVTAIFAGHLHQRSGYVWSMGKTRVPVYLSGSADQKTYLMVEFPNPSTEMRVYRVTNNSVAEPIARVALKTPVKDLAPTAPWKIRVQNNARQGNTRFTYRYVLDGRQHHEVRELPNGNHDFFLPRNAHTPELFGERRKTPSSPWARFMYVKPSTGADSCFITYWHSHMYGVTDLWRRC